MLMSLPVATRIRVSGFLHVASAPRVLFEESRTLCWPLERRFLAALPPFSRRRKGGWVEWSCEEGNGIAAAAAIPFTREKASGGVSLVRGLEDEAKGRGGFSGGVSSLQRRSAPSASLAKKQRASTSWGSDFRGGGSSANAESGFASYSPQRPRHSAFLGSSPAVIRLVTLAVQVAREGSGNSAFWNRICASAAQIQLCYVLSAYGRAASVHARFRTAAFPEVRRRLARGEFSHSFEIAMLATALAKLDPDVEVLESLSARVRESVNGVLFPVRDIAVIAQAFANAEYSDADLFAVLAEASLAKLGSATLGDIARLLQAHSAAAAAFAHDGREGICLEQRPVSADLLPEPDGSETQALATGASVESAFSSLAKEAAPEGQVAEGLLQVKRVLQPLRPSPSEFWSSHQKLVREGVAAARSRLLTEAPADLTAAAHAFGVALAFASRGEALVLRELFEDIRTLAVASLNLFSPQQLASLLLTFARWRLHLPPGDVTRITHRLLHFECWASRAEGTSNGETAAWGSAVFPPCEPLALGSKLSCLFSLGVLLNAAAADVEAVDSEGETPLCAHGPPASAEINLASQRPAERGNADSAAESEARREARRLFNSWLPSIARDILRFGNGEVSDESPESSSQAAAVDSGVEKAFEGGVHHIARFAQVLIHCRSVGSLSFTPAGTVFGPNLHEFVERFCSCFVERRQFLPLLLEMILRRHKVIDQTCAAQLILHLRTLGLPTDHDLLLLLQERDSASAGSVPGCGDEERPFRGGTLEVKVARECLRSFG